MGSKSIRRWQRFWTRYAATRGFGRIASWLAAWNTPPYFGQEFLASFHRHGYVASSARLEHPDVRFGRNVFVGVNVMAFHEPEPGPIVLADRVSLYGDTIIRTGWKAALRIGENTHIQPGCHIYACMSDIEIGRYVEIAARCAFYSYDHGVDANKVIMGQPLQSKGPIVVGDGAWLGHGVIVLAGVEIGEGAVVGAGSVVTQSIPANAIAAGAPARALKFRSSQRTVATEFEMHRK